MAPYKAQALEKAELMIEVLPQAEDLVNSQDRDILDDPQCDPHLRAVARVLIELGPDETKKHFENLRDAAKELCNHCGERAQKENSEFCHICLCGKCGQNHREDGQRFCSNCA